MTATSSSSSLISAALFSAFSDFRGIYIKAHALTHAHGHTHAQSLMMSFTLHIRLLYSRRFFFTLDTSLFFYANFMYLFCFNFLFFHPTSCCCSACVCVYVIFWLYPAKDCLCGGAVPIAVSVERLRFYTLIDGRLLRVSKPLLIGTKRNSARVESKKHASATTTANETPLPERMTVALLLLVLKCPNRVRSIR